MTAGTKDRIRDSAADLFQHQGYHATGVKQIVEGASAQLASLQIDQVITDWSV